MGLNISKYSSLNNYIFKPQKHRVTPKIQKRVYHGILLVVGQN